MSDGVTEEFPNWFSDPQELRWFISYINGSDGILREVEESENGSLYRNETIAGEPVGVTWSALLLLVFPLFTVFGNVLVIMSVKRERSLQNVTNYFIVSLAVADLLVASGVMPFAVYFIFRNNNWTLTQLACDIYIAMDVTCSTSSILNLVAISIDRFIAVTQPIKYAKHKNNTRVWITIVFVWAFSALVGSPIILGLNEPPLSALPTPEMGEAIDCQFHNKYFVIFSSLCSFYIPCAILVFLYYRIFKVIRERAKKAVASRKSHSTPKPGTVIENLAQTKRLAETALVGAPSSLSIPKSNNLDEEKLTNTGSGSQDGEDKEVEGEEASPDSADECEIIPNSQVASAFILEAVREDERLALARGAAEPNGNHDSGYAASMNAAVEDLGLPTSVQESLIPSPKLSLQPPVDEDWKRNGLRAGSSVSAKVEPKEEEREDKKKESRFTICKVHKASRKKREKSSAKRERKATKTLAIVLGLFLACWLPFFSTNMMDALCVLLNKDCNPGLFTFLFTTWLGYFNSCLNPVIYTIFNPEFRKAFKKILGLSP